MLLAPSSRRCSSPRRSECEREDNVTAPNQTASLGLTENNSTQARTYGAAHELLTAASASVTHDVKGNMTSIPAVLRPGSDPLAMSWDFDNKLTGADVDNDSTDDMTYEYDALGRRVQRDDGTTATVFIQNGQQTFADYPSGALATSPTYNYVFASYIDEPVMRAGGGNRYFHRNQQYSVTALTDTSGTIKERYAYTAYGTPTITDASGTVRTTTAEGNRYTYTGREWDEDLDLYHYRARMYDAVSGRFCSRDPIGYVDPSLYRYVQNRPCSLTDPTGLMPNQECAIDLATLISWVEQLEAEHPDETPRQILIRLRDLMKNPRSNGSGGSGSTGSPPTPRWPTKKWAYIYTLKGGWIDVPHFVEAGRCSSQRFVPTWVAVSGGYWVECHQWVNGVIRPNLPGVGSSAFCPEDLPSNWWGAWFGTELDPNTPLSEQLQDFFIQDLGAIPCKAAPDFNSLPATEEDWEEEWFEDRIEDEANAG